MSQPNRVDEIIKLIDDALAENERARQHHHRPAARPASH